MSCYLYILSSKVVSRRYIGIADDITKRVIRHNSGAVRSTKPYRPWEVVYKEVFPDKITARKREVYLKKSYSAREEIFNKIANLAPIV